MLRGIEYIHKQGLAHRDLKSSNVMLTVSGQVKLSELISYSTIHHIISYNILYNLHRLIDELKLISGSV